MEFFKIFLAGLPSVIKEISPWVTLIIGWWLGQKSQQSQRSLDHLQKQMEALMEIRRELARDMPFGLSPNEVLQQWKKDSRSHLLLVRLFGLRNELIPFIDSSIVKIIDEEMTPLYDIPSKGEYRLPPSRLEDLLTVGVKIRKMLDYLETKYIKKYKKYF